MLPPPAAAVDQPCFAFASPAPVPAPTPAPAPQSLSPLDQLFRPLPPGTPGYARVAVLLKVVTRTPKALLVAPPCRPDLTRWVPLSRVRLTEHAATRYIPWGQAELSLPAWLYAEVRAEILCRAKATPAPAATTANA